MTVQDLCLIGVESLSEQDYSVHRWHISLWEHFQRGLSDSVLIILRQIKILQSWKKLWII